LPFFLSLQPLRRTHLYI